MLLYERGLLQLDLPVAAILPDFVSLAPPEQRSDRETVTVRMLLAHSSGLPAYVKLFETAHTRDELVRAALATSLVASPGSKADYSDIGFILLGEILARLAGAPLDVFAQQEIFAPLRMSHTCFNPLAEWKSAIPPTEDDRTFRHRVVQGEVNDENAWVMGGVAGHAGLFAPATDVARFAECMLRAGSPILKPATVELFTRARAHARGYFSRFGLGHAIATILFGHPFLPAIIRTPRLYGHFAVDRSRPPSQRYAAHQSHLARSQLASHQASQAAGSRRHRRSAVTWNTILSAT